MHASQNYIYIILTVVYVIYSIIKAGKKVTQNRPKVDQQPLTKESSGQPSPTVQPQTETPLPQQDFKKMLEDLLGGAPEEKIPEPQVPKVQAPIQKTKLVKTSLQNTHKKEIVTDTHSKLFTAKSHHTSDKNTHSQLYESAKKTFEEPAVLEESPDNRDDFDIRQAIIYSEILKRPEY